MFEVVKSKEPCYFCKKAFVEGDQVKTHSIPIPFRYGKQKKKAKADTHITLLVHVECPKDPNEPV